MHDLTVTAEEYRLLRKTRKLVVIRRGGITGCGIKRDSVRRVRYWLEDEATGERSIHGGIAATATKLRRDGGEWSVSFEVVPVPAPVRLLKRGEGYTSSDGMAIRDAGAAPPPEYVDRLAAKAAPDGEDLRKSKRDKKAAEWDRLIGWAREVIEGFDPGDDMELQRRKRKARRMLDEKEAA